MKRLVALILLPILFACSKSGDRIVVDDGLYAPGRIVVKVTPELSASLEGHTRSSGTVVFSDVKELHDVAAEIGLRRMKRMFAPAGVFEERSRREGLHLWYIMEFDKDVPVSLSRSILVSHPGVDVAECDPIRRLESDVSNALLPSGGTSGPDSARPRIPTGEHLPIWPPWRSPYTGDRDSLPPCSGNAWRARQKTSHPGTGTAILAMVSLTLPPP